MQIPAICAIGMALPWKGLMFLQNYAGVPTHRKRLGNAEPVETKSVAEVMSIMKHDLTSTNLGLQYAFLTEKALSKLTLIDTEMVEREDAV